ncbi:MAG: HEPN domain-containing protein [Paludibacter sp.]
MREELTEEMITALVAYRLERAKDTIQEAVDMLEKDHYNAAINRLYYACYYAVSALLVKTDIQAHTHSGVKQMFGMSFIVNGKLPRIYNVTYTELFD